MLKKNEAGIKTISRHLFASQLGRGPPRVNAFKHTKTLVVVKRKIIFVNVICL